MTIPIKNGKVEGLYKEYYESGALMVEENNKGWFYREGLSKLYYESGALKSEVNFKDGIRVSGKCANGREWTDAELSNFEKGLEVSCGD